MSTTAQLELEAQGLLADILEHPQDDAVRLVCADWLEDRGDYDRAEFIRVQVEIEKYPGHRDMGPKAVCGAGAAGRCWICDLCRRERELLGSMQVPGPDYPRPPGTRVQARHAWAGLVAHLLHDPDGKGWEFRRGFVEAVRCPLQAWLDHGPSLVRAQPLTRVEVSDVQPTHVDRGPGYDPWCWPHESATITTTHSRVRQAFLMAYLTRGWYPTAEAALDHASTACLEWAKAQEP